MQQGAWWLWIVGIMQKENAGEGVKGVLPEQ